MITADIWEEVKEATGSSDDSVNYRALTRGCELLANEGVFDPMIGYVDFFIDGGYLIALPRDVKTPLTLNIDNNPSFSKSRLFEFAMNSPGTVDGEEVGWQWHERGYAVVQDERQLPCKLIYTSSTTADNGKTVIITGRDIDGIIREETLTLNSSAPPKTVYEYTEFSRVSRDATIGDCYIVNSDNDEPLARYYPDELNPEYRVIKLSKTGVAIRMLYTKHVFKITKQTDPILFHSAMAVIQAAKAARLFMVENWESAQLAMGKAIEFATKEQQSRHAGQDLSQALQIQNSINANISTRDSVIVADIFDEASSIFGPIGTPQIFDKITTAIEILSNKGQQEAGIGWCDIWKAANTEAINVNATAKGNGFFVLPRYVQSVLSLNVNGRPGQARNRWYEYHLNGFGEQRVSDYSTWDDFGETVIVNMLPNDPATMKPVGVYLSATCANALDNGIKIRVYAYDLEGNYIRQDGQDGFLVPCMASGAVPASGIQAVSRIERIVKAESNSFIQLNAFTDSAGTLSPLMIGYYYPDETEPKYQMIRIPTDRETRIRIRYRKRWKKIISLNDPVTIRSRAALTSMMQSMKMRGDDLQQSLLLEQLAQKYMDEDQAANNPTSAGSLQFDATTSPFNTCNVQ